MAEVVVQLDPPVTDEEGHTYLVRICGRVTDGGLWEGWIEFHPENEGITLRTPRETMQPDRADLEHWATGLTVSYLEGALERARGSQTPDLRHRPVEEGRPVYERPALSAAEGPGTAVPHGLAAELPTFAPAPVTEADPVSPRAVLNPYRVYSHEGEIALRNQLSALDEGQLRQVVRAYEVVPKGEVDLMAMHHSSLVELIVVEIRKLYAG
jgi:hypothetical protein